MRSVADEPGQAAIETLAALPVLIVCVLVALQGLATGAAWLQADNAAHAAALAAQTGGDGSLAARMALPGWSRGRVRVRERRGRVDVWLTPRALMPPLAPMLRVRGSASFTNGRR